MFLTYFIDVFAYFFQSVLTCLRLLIEILQLPYQLLYAFYVSFHEGPPGNRRHFDFHFQEGHIKRSSCNDLTGVVEANIGSIEIV